MGMRSQDVQVTSIQRMCTKPNVENIRSKPAVEHRERIQLLNEFYNSFEEFRIKLNIKTFTKQKQYYNSVSQHIYWYKRELLNKDQT